MLISSRMTKLNFHSATIRLVKSIDKLAGDGVVRGGLMLAFGRKSLGKPGERCGGAAAGRGKAGMAGKATVTAPPAAEPRSRCRHAFQFRVPRAPPSH
jgi:hypothetical protein